ncbi:MAG TPA: hypothetical protein VJT78_15960 [Candidatus Dormibacteraeota bacterium]|nr:hypothetical protein [Candidatus Dormibacteraeota bacterium]
MPEPRFQVDADSAAREWLNAHPVFGRRVVAYEVHRCCGGGKLCQVSVRELSPREDPGSYTRGALDDGTELLIDRKAAARLPSRFGITLRGLGPLKHLDLDLSGEQWGALLYD